MHLSTYHVFESEKTPNSNYDPIWSAFQKDTIESYQSG